MENYGDYEVLRTPFPFKLLAFALREINLGYYPKVVYFAVTWNCSAKCLMCNIWKRKKGEEVKVEDVEFIFDDKLMRRVKLVKVSGGEALLREDILEILKIIEEKTNALITISTNGLRASRKKLIEVAENIEKDRLFFSVSLDALNEIHSKMRGVKGAFEQVMETLKVLKEMGLNYRLSTTITTHNEKFFEEVIEFAKKENLYIGYRLADVNEVYYSNTNKTFKFSERTFEIIEKHADNKFKKGILEWVKGKRPHRCYALITNIFIDPQGFLHPCIYREKISDLKEEKLSYIWNSEKLREERKNIKGCGRCWTDCQSIPDILTGL